MLEGIDLQSAFVSMQKTKIIASIQKLAVVCQNSLVLPLVEYIIRSLLQCSEQHAHYQNAAFVLLRCWLNEHLKLIFFFWETQTFWEKF